MFNTQRNKQDRKPVFFSYLQIQNLGLGMRGQFDKDMGKKSQVIQAFTFYLKRESSSPGQEFDVEVVSCTAKA